MDFINTSVIVTWLVMAVSLLIISRLNVGIGVADVGKALIAALVIGFINALLGPLLQTGGGFSIANLSSLSLVSLLVNALLLWLAAKIVPGFWLQRGVWSALLGAFLLMVVNALIFWLLGALGIG